MRRIEKLETETSTKQNNLETLRREKIELENTLEQEQEALVNKLWKRMDKLESEKRYSIPDRDLATLVHILSCQISASSLGPASVRASLT
jgi:predicted nuclease with TOPRIM domain